MDSKIIAIVSRRTHVFYLGNMYIFSTLLDCIFDLGGSSQNRYCSIPGTVL